MLLLSGKSKFWVVDATYGNVNIDGVYVVAISRDGVWGWSVVSQRSDPPEVDPHRTQQPSQPPPQVQTPAPLHHILSYNLSTADLPSRADSGWTSKQRVAFMA